MAILKFVNNIYEGFESNEYTYGIFFDLKKTFDTVNHQILIDKLNFYGIRGFPLAWLTSYLDNRQQYVMVNRHVYSNSTVVCGSLKVLFLALYYSTYTLMIFFFLQIIFHLFSLLMTPIFFFAIKTRMVNQEPVFLMSPPGLMQTSLLFILINPNSSSSIHDVNRSILQN